MAWPPLDFSAVISDVRSRWDNDVSSDDNDERRKRRSHKQQSVRRQCELDSSKTQELVKTMGNKYSHEPEHILLAMVVPP